MISPTIRKISTAFLFVAAPVIAGDLAEVEKNVENSSPSVIEQVDKFIENHPVASGLISSSLTGVVCGIGVALGMHLARK